MTFGLKQRPKGYRFRSQMHSPCLRDVRPDESEITNVQIVRHATFFSETLGSSFLPA
jgi:hypothetical protein